MEFDIEKDCFYFCLTAPYSEERRITASEAAKAAASNLTRSVVFCKNFGFDVVFAAKTVVYR